MSFSISLHGHAGPGMEPNGPEEKAAIAAVLKAARAAFKRHKLNLGLAQVSPADFVEDTALLEPIYHQPKPAKQPRSKKGR